MKRFFLIDERRLDESSESLRLIGQAAAALYPELTIDRNLSGLCSSTKYFFMIRNSWEPVWVRVFYESLQLKDLYELEGESAKVLRTISEFREQGGVPTPFIFYPNINNDARDKLDEMPAHWKFFEYNFLQGESKDAVVLKEYKRILPVFTKETLRPETGTSENNRLSDEELKALLELSCRLNELEGLSPSKEFYISPAYQSKKNS